MPGIVGVMQAGPWAEDRKTVLSRMAGPMCYSSSQIVQLFSADRWEVATVEYGEGFTFLKPAIARRDNVLLMIDGEVFPDAVDVPHDLVGDGSTIQRAEYCLSQYLANGLNFVSQLNGSFAIAVLDGRNGKYHLYTDRYCSRPLYYIQRDGLCAFASSIRSLLCYRDDIGRSYDLLAVAELFGFERVFGDKTLFADIKRLSSAYRATWEDNRWTCERWMQPVGNQGILKFNRWQEAAEEFAHRLRRAVAKRTSDGADAAVLLSGGVDSRLILGVSPKSVSAASLVNREAHASYESRIALTAAQACGVKHILIERDENYYRKVALNAPEITEGMVVFGSCHALGSEQQLLQAGIRVTLNGDFFDTVFKCYFDVQECPSSIFPHPFRELTARKAGRMMVDSRLIRKGDRQDLMALALTNQMQDVLAVAREHRIRRLTNWFSADGSFAELADRYPFDELQSTAGFVGFMLSVRPQIVDRSPVYDNDLFAVGLSVPAAWKTGGRIVRRALSIISPTLARIPDANTRLPAGLCAPWDEIALGLRGAVYGAARQLAKVSKTVSKLRKPAAGSSVYTYGSGHDLNAMLRFCPDYRELVASTIESLDPELFDANCIRRIYDDDVRQQSPRFRGLFESVLSFGLFDNRWGPNRTFPH